MSLRGGPESWSECLRCGWKALDKYMRWGLCTTCDTDVRALKRIEELRAEDAAKKAAEAERAIDSAWERNR